jgi:hypothetical protein
MAVRYLTLPDDITDRMSSDAYLRVFDRDGTGAADETFMETCAMDAESEASMRTGASFPGYFDEDGATVDPAIIRHMVALTIYNAVRLNPSAGGGEKELGAFEKSNKQALDFFDRLSRDDRNRLRTGAGGRARPRAAAINTTDDCGEPTNPFTRVMDRKDSSRF